MAEPLKPIGQVVKKLEGSLMRRGGVKDPAVLAAYITRKKNSAKGK